MNPRSTGVLFLIALAVAAFVYFYEIRGGEERLEAQEQSQRLFPGIEARDVEAIWLYAGHGVTRVEREGGGWRLIAPVEFPGDDIVLDGIASALAQLTRETVIESPQAPEVYGLGAKSSVIYFTADGADLGLRLGNKAPVGEGHYVVPASLDPREKVYTVASWRVNAIRKDLDDIRDKRVLDFDREAVDQIRVTWQDGGVELQRVDDAWQVVSPIADAADTETVDRLLSDLAFMRAEGFVDEPLPDDHTGLAAPGLRFELRLGAGVEGTPEGDIPTRTLELGAFPVDQTILARAAYASLYKIDMTRLADFPRRVVAYRNKELAKFDEAEAFAVEFRFAPEASADAPDPDTAADDVLVVRVEKDDAGWGGGDPSVRPERIESLVSELAQLSGDDIIADQLGDEELSSLGLSPARVSIVVFGRKSQAGFGVRLAELEVGVAEPDRGIAVRNPDSRKVYRLDWPMAEFVPVSREAFENRFRAAADDNAGDDAVEALPPEPASS